MVLGNDNGNDALVHTHYSPNDFDIGNDNSFFLKLDGSLIITTAEADLNGAGFNDQVRFTSNDVDRPIQGLELLKPTFFIKVFDNLNQYVSYDDSGNDGATWSMLAITQNRFSNGGAGGLDSSYVQVLPENTVNDVVLAQIIGNDINNKNYGSFNILFDLNHAANGTLSTSGASQEIGAPPLGKITGNDLTGTLDDDITKYQTAGWTKRTDDGELLAGNLTIPNDEQINDGIADSLTATITGNDVLTAFQTEIQAQFDQYFSGNGVTDWTMNFDEIPHSTDSNLTTFVRRQIANNVTINNNTDIFTTTDKIVAKTSFPYKIQFSDWSGTTHDLISEAHVYAVIEHDDSSSG